MPICQEFFVTCEDCGGGMVASSPMRGFPQATKFPNLKAAHAMAGRVGWVITLRNKGTVYRCPVCKAKALAKEARR